MNTLRIDRTRKMFWGTVPALSAALLALGVFTLVAPAQAQSVASSAALDRKS